MATVVQDWKELKEGMHVRLRCGCAGRIQQVDMTGFVLRHWKMPYMDEHEYQFMYEQGGIELAFHDQKFMGNLAPICMPAEPVSPPAWWKEDWNCLGQTG